MSPFVFAVFDGLLEYAYLTALVQSAVLPDSRPASIRFASRVQVERLRQLHGWWRSCWPLGGES